MSDNARDELLLKVDNQLGVLSKDFRIRLLNCSSSGCLVETTSPIEVGTVGTLRLNIDGRKLTELVQIVRCHRIEGAGSLYHAGAEFLWTALPDTGSLRRVIRRQAMGARGPAAPLGPPPLEP
jgi:hypothetical protein